MKKLDSMFTLAFSAAAGAFMQRGDWVEAVIALAAAVVLPWAVRS